MTLLEAALAALALIPILYGLTLIFSSVMYQAAAITVKMPANNVTLNIWAGIVLTSLGVFGLLAATVIA